MARGPHRNGPVRPLAAALVISSSAAAGCCVVERNHEACVQRGAGTVSCRTISRTATICLDEESEPDPALWVDAQTCSGTVHAGKTCADLGFAEGR